MRRGWKSLSPEARKLVMEFVKSQRCGDDYVNAGGMPDKYYTQFGKVLECVFSPYMLLFHLPVLTVIESRGKDDVYGRFFRFISDELWMKRPSSISYNDDEVMMTNAVCCILCMQHQTGNRVDAGLVRWLKERQDESGGFLASEVAPVPDLLSTGVALFTLRLLGESFCDPAEFIDAHWLDNGGFAPTVMDDYSDVEYVFYGLLSL